MPAGFAPMISWEEALGGGLNPHDQANTSSTITPNRSKIPSQYLAPTISWEEATKTIEKKKEPERMFSGIAKAYREGPDEDSLYYGMGRAISGALVGTAQSFTALDNMSRDLRKNLILSITKKVRPDLWEKAAENPELMSMIEEKAGQSVEFGGAHAKQIEAAQEYALKKMDEIRATKYAPRSIAEEAVGVGAELLKYMAANTVAPGSGLALATAEAGGQQHWEAKKRLEAQGVKDPDKKLLAIGGAITSGVIQGQLERIGLGGLKFKGTGKLSNKILDLGFRRIQQLGLAPTAEGLTEALQGATGDLTRLIFEHDPAALKGFWKRRGTEFAIGALGGAAAKGVTATFESVGMIDQKRMNNAFEQAAGISEQEGGIDRLRSLAEKEKPSRADFKEAGIDTKLSAGQRQELARNIKEAVELGEFDSGTSQAIEGDLAAPEAVEPPTTEGEIAAQVESPKPQDFTEMEQERRVAEMTPEQIADEMAAIEAPVEETIAPVETAAMEGPEKPSELRVKLEEYGALTPQERDVADELLGLLGTDVSLQDLQKSPSLRLKPDAIKSALRSLEKRGIVSVENSGKITLSKETLDVQDAIDNDIVDNLVSAFSLGESEAGELSQFAAMTGRDMGPLAELDRLVSKEEGPESESVRQMRESIEQVGGANQDASDVADFLADKNGTATLSEIKQRLDQIQPKDISEAINHLKTLGVISEVKGGKKGAKAFSLNEELYEPFGAATEKITDEALEEITGTSLADLQQKDLQEKVAKEETPSAKPATFNEFLSAKPQEKEQGFLLKDVHGYTRIVAGKAKTTNSKGEQVTDIRLWDILADPNKPANFRALLGELRKSDPTAIISIRKIENDKLFDLLEKQGLDIVDPEGARGLPDAIFDPSKHKNLPLFRSPKPATTKPSELPESMQPEFFPQRKKGVVQEITEEESGAAKPEAVGSLVKFDLNELSKGKQLAAKKTAEFLRNLGAAALSRGRLTKEAHTAKIESIGWANAQVKKVSNDIRDMQKAAKTAFGLRTDVATGKQLGGVGKKKLSDAESGMINEVLAGNLPVGTLPKEMRDPALRMIQHKKELTQQLITRGMVAGELASLIDENGAFHIHTTYNVHSDPDHADLVADEAKNNFKSLILSENPDLNQQQADQLINELLYAGKAADRGYSKGSGASVQAKAFHYLMKKLRFPGAINQIYEKTQAGERISPMTLDKARNAISRGLPKISEVEQLVQAKDRAALVDEVLYKLIQVAPTARSPEQMVKTTKENLSREAASLIANWKQLPKELRVLYGENKAFDVNHAVTTEKIIKDIASDKFFTEVLADGKGKYLWKPTDKNIDPLAKAPITKEANRRWAPLDGYRTYPWMVEALKELDQIVQTGPVIRMYDRINSYVKAGKTVYSVPTQVVNSIGAMSMVISSGHVVPKPSLLRKAVIAGMSEFDLKQGGLLEKHGVSLKEWRKIQQEHIEMGLTDESMIKFEAKGKLEDVKREPYDSIFMEGLYQSAKAPFDIAHKMYQFSDTTARSYIYEATKEDYRRAHPDWSERQIREKSAEIARDTYPTYSMIGKAGQLIRRAPVFGDFAAFGAEVIRTEGNLLRLIQEELSDPKTRAIGAKRALAHVGMAHLVPVAISMLSRMVHGISKEDEDNLRESMAPWDENGVVFHMGKSGDSTWRMFNASKYFPYTYFHEAYRAILRGDDWRNSFGEAAQELSGPFFDVGIIPKAALELVQRDQKIYSSRDPIHKQIADIANHMYGRAEPTSASGLRRIHRGYKGEIVKGKSFNTRDEIAAYFTGWRNTNIDVKNSLRYDTFDYSFSARDENTRLNDLLTATHTVSEKELSNLYSLHDQNSRDLFNTLHKKVTAAIDLGVPKGTIVSGLKDGGASEDLIDRAISGEYKPWVPQDPVVANKLFEVASPAHRVLIADHVEKKLGNLAYAAAASISSPASQDKVVSAAKTLKELGITQAHAEQAMREKWRNDDEKALNRRREKSGLPPTTLKKMTNSMARAKRLRNLSKIYDILAQGDKNE